MIHLDIDFPPCFGFIVLYEFYDLCIFINSEKLSTIILLIIDSALFTTTQLFSLLTDHSIYD